MVVAEFKNENYTSVYGLKQWDFGQKLLIKGTGIQGKTVEVHFALERDNVALRILGTIENENITVCIPDILLQSGNSIYAYVYKSTDTEGKTTHEIFMHVSPRAKPEDYTEKEFKNALQQVLAIAQSVREEADAGKFNATDEQVKQVVDAYMEENPVAITVDKTLTQSGKAADAKATGDKFLQYAIKNTVTEESPVAITDSAEEKLQDLKLFGRTEQVTTTGKNLFNPNMSYEDLVWIREDGAIVGGSNARTSDYISVKQGKYIIQFDVANNNPMYVAGYDIDKAFVKIVGTIIKGKGTINIDDINVKTIRVSYTIDSTKIQLEFSANLTPYKQYTGGKPSPSLEFPQEIKSVGKYNELTGKYEIDVQVTGKNLFDITKLKSSMTDVGINTEENTITLPSGGAIYFNKLKECADLKVGDEVYLFAKSTGKKDFIGFYNGTGGIPQWKFNVRNVITEQMLNSTILLYSDSDKSVILSDIMITKLNDKIYEPYRESQAVTLSLNQQLRGIGEHKDEVTKDGVVRRIKQIMWNGSEKWSLSNAVLVNTNKFYLPKVNDAYSAYRKISSLVDALPFVADENSDELGQRFYLGNPMINLDKEKFPNVDTLKKYLSENPMTVQYVIEKPITEPLPEDFKQAIESLKTYYPTTVVTADGGEVDADIEVTYIADTKNYVDRKIKETVSAQMQNAENILSLMPESVQATMIEKDTNKILEREVTR